MSLPPDKAEQLELLVSALCEGQITPDEAARLEELACESDTARRYFLDYVELHGELYWQYATAGEETPEPAPEPTTPRRFRRPFAWLAHASAASIALTLLGAGLLAVCLAVWLVPRLGGHGQPQAPEVVATLVRTFDARWEPTTPAPGPGGSLAAGTVLDLREGLAEVGFAGGARVILEGPARFELRSPDRGRLAVGSLHARVPRQAAGFTIDTPGALVIDRGTEFGVVVDSLGTSQVHVLVGSVEVVGQAGKTQVSSPQVVLAGNSVRVRPPEADAPPQVEPIPAGSHTFATEIPADTLPGSIAALRKVVESQPGLLHHYTFEGATPAERCRDTRGGLDLLEAVMAGGRGDGQLTYRRGALEATNTAVVPCRDSRSGNSEGVGLQSDGIFQPPDRMTVELLVNFAGFAEVRDGNLAAAVATRSDPRDCGFLVVAVDTGQLAYLLDGEAPWGGATASLVPGEWYYVACTMRVDGNQTEVNLYTANLTRGETTLQWDVQNEMAAGTPAASRLGIGKGFDRSTANAYPWSGLLDEVAVYNRVLDRQTLQWHLDSLVRPAEEESPTH